MQFCPGCGFRIEDESFCPSCGLKQVPLSNYPMASQIPSAPAYKEMPGVEDGDEPRKRNSKPAIPEENRKPGLFSKKKAKAEKKPVAAKGFLRRKSKPDEEEAEEVEEVVADNIVSRLKSETAKASDATKGFDEKDVKGNKGMAALSYCSALVFIPLFVSKDSEYVKYHIRQGMNVFATTVLAFLLKSICVEVVEMTPLPEFLIGILSIVVSLPFYAAFIALAGLSLLGIFYVLRGKAKELPYIGKFNLIGSDDTPIDDEGGEE